MRTECEKPHRRKVVPGVRRDHSRNFPGREMDSHEVVNHPIHIQQSLQASTGFGVGVCPPSEGGALSAQRAEEGFGVVGVNVLGLNRAVCLGMFRPGILIFGQLASFFVCLGPFVLDTDFHALLQGLSGTSRFAPRRTPGQVRADFKQQVSIATFPIGQKGHVRGLVNNLFQCPDRLFEQLFVPLAIPAYAGTRVQMKRLARSISKRVQPKD